MHRQQLKMLVETGHYKPEPALVAQAMLRHRGVRDLLTDARGISAADRTQSASEAHRQVA